MTPPIIVCSRTPYVDRKAYHVLEASVDAYGQGAKLDVYYDSSLNFGQAYNRAVRHAFEDYPEHDRFIIANEDVVLRPDTMRLLIEDADELDRQGYTWGHIACRTDRVARTMQNILRNPLDEEAKIVALPYYGETWVAPIFSMINRKRWIDFPPINWGSDVIQCFDMTANGYRICVSRAYVHHVGGITTGDRALLDREESQAWVREHRPGLLNLI